MSDPQPPLPSAGGPGPYVAAGPGGDGSLPVPAPQPGAGPQPAPGRFGKRSRKALIEWGAIIVVAVVAAVVLRSFVVQPYFIPSGSMEPTLKVGDKVLVDKLSYHLHSVHRGDVIVFSRPRDDPDPAIKDLIKRVIGLPGETISASNGQVDIDGRPLREAWLPRGVTTANFGPVRIPSGRYFVMGDNRGNSADSRVLGPISSNLIVGRAFLVVWPLGHLGTL